jgi:glutamate racemase
MHDDRKLHLMITDSGLGGMAICSEIERNLRRAGPHQRVRITYFNAWPEPNRGYNALPDEATRVGVFDRALARMKQFQPDRIIIACNTLSVLFPLTDFSRTGGTPVVGIIDAGVDLFSNTLTSDAAANILLLGTRTTIESNVHRDLLMQKGIAEGRIGAASCHGLAAAIDQDPGSFAVEDMIRQCAGNACREARSGTPVYAALCCTHYSLVGDRLGDAIGQQLGREVRILDPKDSLAHRIADGGAPAEFRGPENPVEVSFASATGVPPVNSHGQDSRATANDTENPVEVSAVSKVELGEHQRRAWAARLAPVSEPTAQAILSYTYLPDLF